ncbi:MAG: hypothetical protein JXB32_15595 [Deltaproteobacteria bacterium]|nr:hypothetical protein [Deltaproteobacteria bacterium]
MSGVLPGMLLAATCGGGSTDPCSGVDCSGRGFCLADQGTAYCACIPGYHPVSLECAPNDPTDPCAGIDCSGHGDCRVEAGEPVCDCEAGHRHPDADSAACAEGGCELLCVPDPVLDGGADADAGGDGDADADADGDADADADVVVPPGCGNGRVESGEECDDGNPVPQDGCENDCTASCHGPAECDDGNPCTTDSCDALGEGAAICSRAPADGAACDDGRFCTATDRCSGGTCIGSGDPCPSGPCATGCDEGGDRCGYAPAGTTCRASGGVCDLAETCSGSAAACPSDALRSSSYVCRSAGSSAICDPEERCTGSSTACPADARAPNNTICRDDGTLCGRAKSCHVCLDGACVLNSDHWSASCLPSCGVIETFCEVEAECCGAGAVCAYGAPGGESHDCGGACCIRACCFPSEPWEYTCDDRHDNDCDLMRDCNDPDCDGMICDSGGGICQHGICMYMP